MTDDSDIQYKTTLLYYIEWLIKALHYFPFRNQTPTASKHQNVLWLIRASSDRYGNESQVPTHTSAVLSFFTNSGSNNKYTFTVTEICFFEVKHKWNFT